MIKKENASDLSRLEDDDAPPWGEDVFARAELRHGDTVLRAATGSLTKRGRPRSVNPKRQVTLRLDNEIIHHFRAGGPGWQSRINAALKKTLPA